MLDLGSGAGHNAVHLKSRFACTLVDLAPAMLVLARRGKAGLDMAFFTLNGIVSRVLGAAGGVDLLV